MIAEVAMALAIAAALLLLATAALAPLETMSWWAGWTERDLSGLRPGAAIDPAPADGSKTRFIVYLSGVASITGRHLLPRERKFVAGLARSLPEAQVIDDVFPYAPSGAELGGGGRALARLWRWLNALTISGRRSILLFLINMRNIYQVMVSADRRYGPIYNQGAAEAIERALLKAGYTPFSRAPVTIIGYSGGAQIAIGAAPFLTAHLGAPVDAISIGGVMASDPGIKALSRIVHLKGDRDRVARFGALVFPQRWPIAPASEWNAARRAGRARIERMADMAHAGGRGYFGLIETNGLTRNDLTLARVVAILRERQALSEN